LQICRAMRGAFPTDVARRLSRIRIKPGHSNEVREHSHPGWPEPHPIDFDWRFTDPTADFLAEQVGTFQDVLCIGTPTVFARLAAAGRPACLVDRNPLLASAFNVTSPARIVAADVNEVDLSHCRFDAAILDPPW